MRNFSRVAPALFALATAVPVAAQENPERLKVGAEVADFTLKDQNGKDTSLTKMLAEKPVALVFYRSADW